MNSSPSMAAIAKRAGVAKSTVSLALRNDPRITREQRKRILKIAEQMGYRTNALVARLMAELRKSRKQIYLASLAVINVWKTPEESNLQTSNTKSWLAGFEERATQLGYSIDRFWINDPEVKPARLASILNARNVQGVIFHGIRSDNCLNDLHNVWTRFPSVVIGARLHKPPLSFVINDHHLSAMQACQQLAAAGYRRIGIVLDRWLDEVVEHRYVAGYFATMGISVDTIPPLFHVPAETANIIARQTQKEQLATWIRLHRPDAIICINSYLLDWMREMGISVPDKIGVALLDLPEDLKGKVAGMDPRSRETAKKAIDVLVGQLHRGEFGVPEIQSGTLIENQWIPGESIRSDLKAPKRRTAKRKK